MRILIAGALGEVGRSVSIALENVGHEIVPVSSRFPIDDAVSVIGLHQAEELISRSEIDLVVIAATKGDHREGAFSGNSVVQSMAPVVARTMTPAVLLSTLRVLEGHVGEVGEDAPSAPLTDYARNNMVSESEWLTLAGPTVSVLRIANFFCLPYRIDSPQSQLLPWSLVHEALSTGWIDVKSGPLTTREFVSASDVARAVELLVTSRPTSRVCATLPGCRVTLESLAASVCAGFTHAGRKIPRVTFGTVNSAPPAVTASWLIERSWSSTLTAEIMAQGISEWLVTNSDSINKA